MKIAKLETFSNRYVCFVRVTSDSGAVGWGQTSTYNADITALIFHRQVAPWALGASALEIDPLIERIEEHEHKFPGSYRCRADPTAQYRAPRARGSDSCRGTCARAPRCAR